MREIFKSGSVGGAPGNRCFYLEADALNRAADLQRLTGNRIMNRKYTYHLLRPGEEEDVYNFRLLDLGVWSNFRERM